jgi:hypothetical protein
VTGVPSGEFLVLEGPDELDELLRTGIPDTVRLLAVRVEGALLVMRPEQARAYAESGTELLDWAMAHPEVFTADTDARAAPAPAPAPPPAPAPSDDVGAGESGDEDLD